MKNEYLFGAGLEGVKALYYLKDTNIKAVIDSHKKGKLAKYDIIHPDSVHYCEDNFFYVATIGSAYYEIKRLLEKKGYIEFKNFIPWRCFGKKICYLHGNCHMYPIRDMLKDVPMFFEEYGFYPIKNIWSPNVSIDEQLYKKIDIFISQDIRKENQFGPKLSTDYILPKLRNNSKKIIIPNLFGAGRAFFPQFIYNRYNGDIAEDTNGMFPHGDKYIDKLHDEEKTVNDIYEIIIDKKLIPKNDIINNFNFYMNKIKEREINWDVKIYDFLMDNFRDKQLFYDQGHPTNFVIREIVLKLMKLLGIEGTPNEAAEMNIHEEFVYPCVTEALNLKWQQKYIRKRDSAKKLKPMDLITYVQERV